MSKEMKKQVEPYGTSTIAFSLYNLLALRGEASSVDEMLDDLKMIQHPLLELPQLSRALDRLEEKKLVVRDGAVYRIADKRRRVIVERDLSDAAVDPETGELVGGWNDWMMRDPRRGLIPIEEVLR